MLFFLICARAEFSNYLILIIFIENISRALKYTKLISVSARPDHNVNDVYLYFYFNFHCPDMKSYRKNDVNLLSLAFSCKLIAEK